MAKGYFKLKGFDEYLQVIADAGKSVDGAAEKAVIAGADVLLAGMQRRVPKDTLNLHDHLKRTQPKREGNFVSVQVGVLEADADTARYGNVQEFGSATMKAQPYIRPTLDGDRAKMRRAQREALEADGVL